MIDEEDGEPVWDFAEDAPMPGGFRAWERLGVGQRCETWLAWSPRLWTPAVLKLPRPHLAAHPRAARSLSREVAALRDNLHPVLPRLYDSGYTDEVHYIAVEYIDGPSLADEIDDNGAILPDEVALLGIQVLTALRTLHQRGLAHIDVKPDNIVVRDGRPVLIDFGSARELGAEQPAGHPVGTAGYAPPEMEACEPISAAMDVYALGVTLCEAAGTPTGALGEILNRMCDPDPARRPSDHAALVALGGLFSDELRPWPKWAAQRPSGPKPSGLKPVA